MSEPTRDQVYKWEGASGKQYEYWVRPIYTLWKEMPGNFIYAKAKHIASGDWEPLYIGQTRNLRQGLADSEKAAEAIRLGATYIHAHVSGEIEEERLAEVRDLVGKHQPPCNKGLQPETTAGRATGQGGKR
jgi:hypothetical protein